MRAGPLLLISLLAAASLQGCDSTASSPVTETLDISTAPIHFSALGDSVQLDIQVVDAGGSVRAPQAIDLVSRNSQVATVLAGAWVRATGNGSTTIVASAAGASSDSVTITVVQAIDSLVVNLPTPGILSIGYNALLPLSCRAFDAGGNQLPLATSVQSKTGRVQGTSCADLRAIQSGRDTLIVTAGSYQTLLPLVVAILPEVLTPPDAPFPVDSMPPGAPWSPSLYRASTGELQLYFTLYVDAPYPIAGVQGDLHRLTSQDGLVFKYDGVALKRATATCSTQGTGIENVAIAPRAESPGWRMFFAAGSFSCYGWQVFSAVSDDERHWVKESGVRVSNGSSLSPNHTDQGPWPSGEGMVVDSIPGGGWKMIVGAYEHLQPRENRFQIVEWRSPDQLTWNYVTPVLTTRQIGAEVDRSIYSPSIQTVAPGLQRMYFTGDNLKTPGGQSRIYTAVSVDDGPWEVEGVVLNSPGANYFYSTMIDDLLVFVREGGGIRSLGSVRIKTR